jgi:hypothetical protein
MIGDKLIAELFIAPIEGTAKVQGISGHFQTEKLLDFLFNTENNEIYTAGILQAIEETYGNTDGMYNVTCELNYIELENQGEFNEHVLPGYYSIGKIISIREEIIS